MVRDTLADLERLVDRLIAERDELQGRNTALIAERERLVADRGRISGELDKLLHKLDLLAGDER